MSLLTQRRKLKQQAAHNEMVCIGCVSLYEMVHWTCLWPVATRPNSSILETRGSWSHSFVETQRSPKVLPRKQSK